MRNNRHGQPFKGYKTNWILADVKTVAIIVGVLILVLGPLAAGWWFYKRNQRRQQIFDSAVAACPQDRSKMMCVKNIEKMHEVCMLRSADRQPGLKFDYYYYRSCVGVPVQQKQFDLSQTLENLGF